MNLSFVKFVTCIYIEGPRPVFKALRILEICYLAVLTLSVDAQ